MRRSRIAEIANEMAPSGTCRHHPPQVSIFMILSAG
jgi:hypothetical protein